MDTLTQLVLLFSTLSLLAFAMFPSQKKWNPRGKHCYVTGGSSGTGLALAILLTKAGADVSIVARDEERLKRALELMEKERQTPNQILKSYSFSLTDADASAAAIEAVCEPHGGRSPDAVFMCAGASTPGYFIEENEQSMRSGMDYGYWIQAWTALAASKRMVKTQTQGKLIFVSSILGYMSFAGYSTYTPAKHALRGLSETLRHELLLYNIGVHICFPGTIYSPGYDNENKTKPKLTLEIEARDGGMQPEQVAKYLLDGVVKGNFHITGDFIGNVFRSSTRGSTPQNNVFLDTIYSLIGWIALPDWRRGADKTVIKHRQEHHEYLVTKGVLDQ
ncbi:hypothetical protein ONZ45_g13631 [Pleurotus djamor]|nr:hypothetical protein ONZ45_g13631 [Pleurotus djamor]